MAKVKKKEIEVDFDNLDSLELPEIDHVEISESITKNQVIAEIRTYVVEEYINMFSNSNKAKVSVAEFLKAQEIIVKLKGFDEPEADDLPKVIKLLLP